MHNEPFNEKISKDVKVNQAIAWSNNHRIFTELAKIVTED